MKQLPLLLTSALCAMPGFANESSPYDPAWAEAPVSRTISLIHDSALSDTENGQIFKDSVQALQPGDRLVVGDGTWSVDSLFEVGLVGTEAAPIRIEAAEGSAPILTRPDANQNCINLGGPGSGPTRFLLIRGFEITGGSIGIRVQDCEDLWIDRCHVHHTGAVTLRASSDNTARLTITRNEFDHASTVSDTGEGLYLGANFGAVVTHHTVVALNTVHDMYTDQGDGIELKQGSYACVVAENVVYNTNFPGITVYGTAGEERNVVVGNTVWNANENAMQVQGEAYVANNVAWGKGDKSAFVSFDHQDTAVENEIVNNTFFTETGTSLRVVNWANRPGMVLANNALYSESGFALFSSGGDLSGVDVSGNVVFGSVEDGGLGGHQQGTGLGDFVDVTW
ncbi:MAG: right-handed parallel beta-helix repeat-containing protein, partial [Planctomycetota bacterium]